MNRGNNKKKIPGSVVYVVRAGDFHKIGVASNVTKRIESLQVANPFRIELILTINEPDVDAYVLEKCLHEFFISKKVIGEWFVLSDSDILLLQNSYNSISHKAVFNDVNSSKNLASLGEKRIYDATMVIQYWVKINRINDDFYTDGLMVTAIRMCIDYTVDQIVESMDIAFKQYVSENSWLSDSHDAFLKVSGILYNKFKKQLP